MGEFISEHAEAVLAVLSIFLAVFFYLKGRRFKQPLYCIRSAHLIRNMDKRKGVLEITYDGESIANLTATKVAFWNNGSETIDGRDIAPADPLLIRVSEGHKILDVEVLGAIRVANEFSISKSSDGASAAFSFNFLDKGEGATIQILHTGSSSRDIEVRGTIKGARLQQREDPVELKSGFPLNMSLRSFKVFVFLGPLTLLPLNVITHHIRNPWLDGVMWVTTGLMIALGWTLGLILLREGLPKGFDIFEEPFGYSDF